MFFWKNNVILDLSQTVWLLIFGICEKKHQNAAVFCFSLLVAPLFADWKLVNCTQEVPDSNPATMILGLLQGHCVIMFMNPTTNSLPTLQPTNSLF